MEINGKILLFAWRCGGRNVMRCDALLHPRQGSLQRMQRSKGREYERKKDRTHERLIEQTVPWLMLTKTTTVDYMVMLHNVAGTSRLIFTSELSVKFLNALYSHALMEDGLRSISSGKPIIKCEQFLVIASFKSVWILSTINFC